MEYDCRRRRRRMRELRVNGWRAQADLEFLETCAPALPYVRHLEFVVDGAAPRWAEEEDARIQTIFGGAVEAGARLESIGAIAADCRHNQDCDGQEMAYYGRIEFSIWCHFKLIVHYHSRRRRRHRSSSVGMYICVYLFVC